MSCLSRRAALRCAAPRPAPLLLTRTLAKLISVSPSFARESEEVAAGPGVAPIIVVFWGGGEDVYLHFQTLFISKILI